MLGDRTVKPYFLRAIYEWCIDCNHEPYILALEPKNIPAGLAKDGRIVFNISPESVRKLLINDETVSFEARFSNQVRNISITMDEVLAIYEGGSGKGLFFPENTEAATTKAEEPTQKPELRVL